MSGSNVETLRSYAARVEEYAGRTSSIVAGAARDWIDAALTGLPAEARIVDVGSAFGRDAAYMAAKSYQVECTDAVPGFVSHLPAKGFAARPFNALTDALSRMAVRRRRRNLSETGRRSSLA